MSTSPFVRIARSLRVWHLAVTALVTTVAVALPAGCSNDAHDLGTGAPPTGGTCEDGDGDGFGLGCLSGADCDDADVSITMQCLCDDHPAPGCACDAEGEHLQCGKVMSKVGGQITCGQGDSVCHNGVWADCIINNTVTLAPQSGPGSKPQTLGGPSACTTNPCDPYCTTFLDTPSGLTDADGGVLATDAGLTLLGNVTVPPAQCSGGVSGTCAHHICETGSALAQGCDSSSVSQTVNLFTEDFHDNSQGWTPYIVPTGNPGTDTILLANATAEWDIAVPATASVGGQVGLYEDPALDTTPTADNGVAGVKVGGHATTAKHAAYYLVSPVIDASFSTGGTLQFERFLNSDGPLWMKDTVYACNGLDDCTQLWVNPFALKDQAWTTVSYTIPAAYMTSGLQIVFGIQTGFFLRAPVVSSSWNIDDVVVTGTKTGCASQVCAVLPSCCSTLWTYNCTNLIQAVCGLTCGTVDGVCSVCYQDSSDHDGDGFSYAAGDCADCDPNANPGAYDFPNNGVDEDCNGVADDEPTSCDVGLAMQPGASLPYEYVKAIDLCRTTTASGANWGVLQPGANIVRANAWPTGNVFGLAAHDTGYTILPDYGSGNFPQHGDNMLVLSSGTALRPTDPGYVAPTFPPSPGGFSTPGDAVNYPPGFPKAGSVNGVDCPLPQDSPGPFARDSVGLFMKVKVPTNAQSFSFDFNFFSAEYFTEVCTDHNDTFTALLQSQGHPLDAVNGDNISFDAQNNVISVNSALFSVPGNPLAFNHPQLMGTGYDETLQSLAFNGHPAFTCFSGVCGGATDWLQTSVPVVPGETISIQFNVWDTSNHYRDSMVLLDNWQWSVSPATLQTNPIVPPPPVLFTDGYFVRDYDVSSVCASGTSPVWGLWSWTATTPTDSQVAFSIQTAATAAELATAPSDPLEFSNPPYPANDLTGNCSSPPCTGGVAAVAAAALSAGATTYDTQLGSSVVDTTLVAHGRATNLPHLRVTSHLAPSVDKLFAPTLAAWNLQVDCVPDQ